LPLAMERAQVATIAELDAKLREFGSSLAKERQAFAEQVLAREMIRNNLNPDEEVSHEELVRYYQEHLDEYSYKERVRWEHLCTLKSFFPDKWAARSALVAMGNRVREGAPLAEIARQSS